MARERLFDRLRTGPSIRRLRRLLRMRKVGAELVPSEVEGPLLRVKRKGAFFTNPLKGGVIFLSRRSVTYDKSRVPGFFNSPRRVGFAEPK